MSSWPKVAPRHIPLEIKKGFELNEKRYVIGDLLGSGGFGTVWKATDKVEARDVAIKRLHRLEGTTASSVVLAEAESTKKLTGHKNIVQLYETFVENDEGFLVMEYVDGGSLQDLLRKHVLSSTWIDQEDGIDYLKQMLEALIFAHSAGLYHRDITPSNVLISSVGLLKLADFGLAKAMTEEMKSHGQGEFAWSGTLHYMSTEQARGESLSHLTDIMSAGIIAYILLTGRHPFNHPSAILTVGELIKEPSYSCPSPVAWDGKPLKNTLSEVLRKLLCKDKAARYQSLVEPLSLLSQDSSIQCQTCLHSNAKTAKFCNECGSPLRPLAVAQSLDANIPGLSAEELTATGFQRTRVNDWDGAIRNYRDAIKKDSKHAAAYANLGFALNRKGEYAEAILQGEAGLACAKDAGIRHRLYDVVGFAKYSLNRPREAIKDYTAALDLRDNPRSFVNRAEAFATIGDIPSAYEDVTSALYVDETYLPAVRLEERLKRLL
jgi:serine/threonine protein kinase